MLQNNKNTESSSVSRQGEAVGRGGAALLSKSKPAVLSKKRPMKDITGGLPSKGGKEQSGKRLKVAGGAFAGKQAAASQPTSKVKRTILGSIPVEQNIAKPENCTPLLLKVGDDLPTTARTKSAFQSATPNDQKDKSAKPPSAVRNSQRKSRPSGMSSAVQSNLDSLNKTMVQLPASRKDSRLLKTKDEEGQSQRSSSVPPCDNRSAAPFSVNESDLLQPDYDSAVASIADLMDFFDCGNVKEPFIGMADFELSEAQQAQCQVCLPRLDDASVMDELNQAFINEHSMVNPAPLMLGRGDRDLCDVKSQFENIELQKFSITEMLERNSAIRGRRTQTVQKPRIRTGLRPDNDDENEQHQ